MMIFGAGGSMGSLAVRVVALSVVLVSPAVAGFVTLSPTGTTGPGGTVTFAEIGPFDPTSANLNTAYTRPASIGVTFTVSDGSPVELYGTAVNDSASTWVGFSGRVIAGSAAFQNPNNLFDPYGTYTDTAGWSVTLSRDGLEADFSGGSIVPGDSLDLFLGLVVSNPSQPVTIALTPAVNVPEPPSGLLVALAAASWGLGRSRRVRPVVALRLLAVGVGLGLLGPSGLVLAGGPSVAPAYQGRFTVGVAGVVGGSPTQMAFGPDGRVYVMTVDSGPISYAYDPVAATLAGPVAVAPQVKGIGIGFHGTDLYLSSTDGTIHKLKDGNGNGVYGEGGEFDVAIVTGIPQGDHNTDQIQVAGDTLYVGIGRRTINGRVRGLDERPARRPRRAGVLQRRVGSDLRRLGVQRDDRLDPEPERRGRPDRLGQRLGERFAPATSLQGRDPGRCRPVPVGRPRASWRSTRRGPGTRSGSASTRGAPSGSRTTSTGPRPWATARPASGCGGIVLNCDFSVDVHDQLCTRLAGGGLRLLRRQLAERQPDDDARRARATTWSGRPRSTTLITKGPTPSTTRPTPTASVRVPRRTGAPSPLTRPCRPSCAATSSWSATTAPSPRPPGAPSGR